jgi:hypothetical protein
MIGMSEVAEERCVVVFVVVSREWVLIRPREIFLIHPIKRRGIITE